MVTSEPWHGYIWQEARPRICLRWQSVFRVTETKSLIPHSSKYTAAFLFKYRPGVQNYNFRCWAEAYAVPSFSLQTLQDSLFHTLLKLTLGSSKLAKNLLLGFFKNLFCAQSFRSMQNYLSKQVIYLCTGLTKLRLQHS